MASKLEQINRDTNGPPNQCMYNNHQGSSIQCKETSCRNQNKTWSRYCAKHKDDVNQRSRQYYQKRKQQINQEATKTGSCKDCGEQTSILKNGKGYRVQCDECAKEDHQIFHVIKKMKLAKQARDIYTRDKQTLEEIRMDIKMQEIAIETYKNDIKNLEEKLGQANKILDDYKQGEQAFMEENETEDEELIEFEYKQVKQEMEQLIQIYM